MLIGSGTQTGKGAALADRADHRVLIPPMSAAPQRPPGDVVWSFEGQTMGTTWSVKAIAAPGTDRVAIDAAIQSELDTVIALFSPWQADSEVSRFNAASPGQWALSQDFWALLNAAMCMSDDTDGAVDPTLGALVDLWGFGPPGPRPVLLPVPGDDEIEAARAISGWQRLRLNPEHKAAVQIGGMKLDFSAIAKGHAVDRVSAALTTLGATSHLVEIGGELLGRGVKPDAQPWWVDIEAPPTDNGIAPLPRTVVALIDKVVATSGDYRRAFTHEGQTYAHTLDGRTGRPVDNGLTSVSVIHDRAMAADALSTALMVMGPDDGMDLARSQSLAARFTERSSTGWVEHFSPEWQAMMDEDPA